MEISAVWLYMVESIVINSVMPIKDWNRQKSIKKSTQHFYNYDFYTFGKLFNKEIENWFLEIHVVYVVLVFYQFFHFQKTKWENVKH